MKERTKWGETKARKTGDEIEKCHVGGEEKRGANRGGANQRSDGGMKRRGQERVFSANKIKLNMNQQFSNSLFYLKESAGGRQPQVGVKVTGEEREERR